MRSHERMTSVQSPRADRLMSRQGVKRTHDLEDDSEEPSEQATAKAQKGAGKEAAIECLRKAATDPITQQIMMDPVKGGDGWTMDRWSLWFSIVSNGGKHPLTGMPATRHQLGDKREVGLGGLQHQVHR